MTQLEFRQLKEGDIIYSKSLDTAGIVTLASLNGPKGKEKKECLIYFEANPNWLYANEHVLGETEAERKMHLSYSFFEDEIVEESVINDIVIADQADVVKEQQK